MPQIINTNIASLTAQRNLNRSQSANQQALTRLSSGLRINSSKDDAAGLAISTRFSSQIRGLNVAIRNVGDGVSLAQTADGALGTMTDNLQRIRELAIQSANATNSSVDREALQAEVSQLVAEISRTGEQTTFNGINLLDGDFNATFQIGANVGETVSFGISELTADSLGGGKAAGVSAVGNANGLANGDLVINGVVVGASTAADDSASTADAASSAIAKVAAINRVADQTGVEATVLENTATGTAMQTPNGGANATSGTIVLNGVTISIATGDVDSSADRAAVITAINAHAAETGVLASDSGSDSGGVTLTAADGRNIALTFTADASNDLTAASTGLTSNAVTQGGYTLTAVNGSDPIAISDGTGSLANAGLVAGSFSANTAAVNSVTRSSRAEVVSDVGDIGPLAATITGGEVVDLSNANYSSGDTTFDLTISGATSTFENGTATVTLNGDFRTQTLQDLVDEINSDLTGSIAAEAFILDGDKLGFRRTSAEAGDLQLGNFTVGSVPGGSTTIIASLGLQSTDTVGAGTTLDSDTNAARGGQAGRAALTGTAAVQAAIKGDSIFIADDYSGTNAAQFDLIVADATTAADNGTFTLVIDTDFSGNDYAQFASDSADAQRVLDALNEDIANAGGAGIVEAAFDPTGDLLVFRRVNAETGGTIQLANYVSSVTMTATTQAANFGFTDGRINTDTNTALNTVGADAKAPGAADAIGGSVIGIDTNSVLIAGGYDSGANDGSFTAFSTAAGPANIDGGNTVDTDFSTNTLSFTVNDGVNSVAITLDANYTNTAGVLSEINSQLAAGSSNINVVAGGGTDDIAFTNSETGTGARVELTGFSGAGDLKLGTAAANIDGGDTVDTDFRAGNGLSFDVYDGFTTVTVVLDDDYTNSAGVIAEIASQLSTSNVTAVAGTGTDDVAFQNTLTGSHHVITLSDFAGAGDIQHVAATSSGTLAATVGTDGNHDFTYNLGGQNITIDLLNSPNTPAAYTAAAGGGLTLANYINSQSGLTASYSTTTRQFTITATDGTTDLTLVDGANTALEYLGLTAGTFAHTPEVTGTATQEAVVLNSLAEGDLKINGVTIGSSTASSDTASSDLAASSNKAASGIAIAAAINASSAETGVSALVNATVVNGGTATAGTTDRVADGDQGVLYINGFATSTLALGANSEVNRTDAISAINQISGQTGVVASDAGGYIRLTAADGRNVSVAIDNLGTTFTGSNVGLDVSRDGIAEDDFSGNGSSYASVAETTSSTVTLSGAREFAISAGTNGTGGLSGLGLIAGTYGGSEHGEFLTDIDISTVEGAEAAILALDNAIATVSSQRADLGAIQNRLESTVGNLTITAENLTAANSRILDADFAVETAELSRSQVLQQAGISILAQANASSQQVLALLQ